MKAINIKAIKHEQGVVLLTSLLILLVMTIIGVASMQTTSLEEKMAGNLRDRDVAFQAAESALRDGEDYIESIVTTGGFTGSGGLYPQNYTGVVTWSTSDSVAYSKTIDGVNSQPRYTIQLAGVIKGNTGPKNQGGYGKMKPGGDVTGFEVTARGIGKSSATAVILRSLYGRRL